MKTQAYYTESNEVIARLAFMDAAHDTATKNAILENSMCIREMIGKRIRVLEDIEEHAMITRVHGEAVPKTRKQMLNHKYKEQYLLGEKKELESFARLEVLKLVDRPTHGNVMKCGWVYDVKKGLEGETIYKSRLIAKGYSQVHGVDFFDVFSPTMQVKSFRTMLALAANDASVMTESWDVSTAFLYAPMDEDV